MKQNFVTMTQTIGDTKVKHYKSLDTENKFLNPIWINPIFGYRVKITPDINPIYGLMDLS